MTYHSNLLDNIPVELTEKDNWCVFRKEWQPDKNKFTKRPYNAMTGQFAKSNDPSTWTDFESACEVLDSYDGLGYFFDGEEYGVDLDNMEPEILRYQQGDYEDNIVATFINMLGSYAEISPSGKGVHIICKGQLPPGGRRKGDIEMYDSGRFFTVTGNQLGPYKRVADDDEGKINYLHHKFIGESSVPIQDLSQVQSDGNNIPIDELLEEAFESSSGARMKSFYDGTWTQFYTDHSAADLALANDLAYWTGRDYEKMDTMFRKSTLYRDKWDEIHGANTYGYLTLMRAISDTVNVYVPFTLNISEEALKGTKKPLTYKSYDDMGNTQRFLEAYGSNVLYSYTNKNWYVWNHKYWMTDDMGKIQLMADDVIKNIKKEPIYVSDEQDDKLVEEAQKAKQKHIKYSRSYRGKENMLKDTQHHVAVSLEDFDKDGLLFNTHTGVIDLNTLTVMKHEDCKQKYCTRISNAEYRPDAQCPRWLQFLNEIFEGNETVIQYVQKAIGYSLTNLTVEQKMFILLGNGKNGKSVFTHVLSELFGSYGMNMQPDTIAVKGGVKTGSSDIARLKGARFVITTEPNNGMKLDEGTVKQITGGEKVTARFLYANDFEYSPEFKIWMGTNYRPIISGTDEGIWRRMVIIPFNYTVPDDKVNKKLVHELLQELTGILNWALEGYSLWRAEGLDNEPLCISMEREKYRTEMDVVARFVSECCYENPNAEVQASVLYRAYKDWASENNEYAMNNTKFGLEVTKKFPKGHTRTGTCYQGIILKTKLNFSGMAINDPRVG